MRNAGRHDTRADDDAAPSRQSELIRAALVARRHLIDGVSKVEIADRLGISRFKVARLLDLARRENLVKIEVAMPLGIHTDLGQRLESAYRLHEAWVLDSGAVGDDELRTELGRLGALMLVEMIEAGDVLGVSWGRTMRAVVSALPPLPPCTVVQLAGGLPNDTTDGAGELVRRFAERTTGDTYQLHAPLFVRDRMTAKRLRSEPQISPTMSMFSKLTKVIIGLGAFTSTSPIGRALSEQERETLQRMAPAAEMCGMWFANDGTVLTTELTQRTMAVSERELRSAPEVIVVAGGRDKRDALGAILASGICSRLVTDRAVAESLLGGC